MSYRGINLTRLQEVNRQEENMFTLGINRNLAEGNEGFARRLARDKLTSVQRERLNELEHKSLMDVARRSQIDKQFVRQLRNVYPSISETQINRTLGDKSSKEKELLLEELIKAQIRGRRPEKLIRQLTGTEPVIPTPPLPPQKVGKSRAITDIPRVVTGTPRLLSVDERLERLNRAGLALPASIQGELEQLGDEAPPIAQQMLLQFEEAMGEGEGEGEIGEIEFGRVFTQAEELERRRQADELRLLELQKQAESAPTPPSLAGIPEFQLTPWQIKTAIIPPLPPPPPTLAPNATAGGTLHPTLWQQIQGLGDI